MAGNSPLQWIFGKVTQTGADVFTQLQIATGLFGQTKTAYQVREIWLEWPPLGSAAMNIAFEIGIKTAAAISDVSDKTLLWRRRRNQTTATAVGFALYDCVERLILSSDEAFYIVSDPLFARVASATTGVANAISFRLGYQQVNLSDVDRLSLLASSLS